MSQPSCGHWNCLSGSILSFVCYKSVFTDCRNISTFYHLTTINRHDYDNQGQMKTRFDTCRLHLDGETALTFTIGLLAFVGLLSIITYTVSNAFLQEQELHESWQARVYMRVSSTLVSWSNENKSCTSVEKRDFWRRFSSTLVECYQRLSISHWRSFDQSPQPQCTFISLLRPMVCLFYHLSSLKDIAVSRFVSQKPLTTETLMTQALMT